MATGTLFPFIVHIQVNITDFSKNVNTMNWDLKYVLLGYKHIRKRLVGLSYLKYSYHYEIKHKYTIEKEVIQRVQSLI
jgi:hypothetical protein